MNFRQRFKRFTRRYESGQSIILLAIGFIALIAFVGITTDVSLMFVRYSQLSRAVDAAAIAAANQMRQDRSQANLGIAARQFVELYGVSPDLVLVDTCTSITPSHPDYNKLCRLDQAKLVKVTAQIQSPTVFLRLLGFQSFTLQAFAISETAALDVVVIMDVSESMASLTTPEDWAKIGLGVIYRPPRFTDVALRIYPNLEQPGGPTLGQAWEGNPAAGVPNDKSLLNTWQQNVNDRLYYADGNGNEPGADPNYEVIFDKTYFNGKVTDANGVLVTTQNHPRVECRVRFFASANETPVRSWLGFYNTTSKTYARLIGSDTTYADSLFGKLGPKFTWTYNGVVQTFFDGFVPTYNYYGCCNNPDGDTNNDFSDLICQPFKQARDAVLQFMDRLDFIRGDRMAVVTFDRTAFLLNPFGYEITSANPLCTTAELAKANPICRPQAMMDNGAEAREAVENLLGVRAEPNFYVYEPGTFTADPGNPVARVTASWPKFAAGIGDDGKSIEVEFDKRVPFQDLSQPASVTKPLNPALYHYPVKDNCPFKSASVDGSRSFYEYSLHRISHPNIGDNSAWKTYADGTSKLYKTVDAGVADVTSYEIRMSYEGRSSCRGSNIGAGLRMGNNALLNPDTIRDSGTIWVMIMLANGGAGASDPVRRNRDEIVGGNPYAYDTTKSQFGIMGEYGAFGVCPYGTPQNASELVLPNDDTPKFAFPFCSDDEPRTRHSCNFRPKYSLDASGDPLGGTGFKNPATGQVCTVEGPTCVKLPATADSGYVFYYPNRYDGINGPKTAADETAWNSNANNLYDLDLTGCNVEKYDVDDYARDWADYVALRSSTDASGTLLPTIFTIGFGTEYSNRTKVSGASSRPLDVRDPDDIQDLCDLNVGDCLGEQVLRYIADVGDNNALDNDYYEYQANPGTALGTLDPTYNSGSYGPRDPCQLPDAPIKVNNGQTETYDFDNNGSINVDEDNRMYGHYYIQQNCGNYYYAPDYSQLQFVFDDIASRMFTRLSR
jgi:hypothetical protein